MGTTHRKKILVYFLEQSVRLTNEASIHCHQLHWSAGEGRPRVSLWYPEGSELRGVGMAEREWQKNENKSRGGK